jgi:hypothetical protein
LSALLDAEQDLVAVPAGNGAEEEDGGAAFGLGLLEAVQEFAGAGRAEEFRDTGAVEDAAGSVGAVGRDAAPLVAEGVEDPVEVFLQLRGALVGLWFRGAPCTHAANIIGASGR